MDDYISRKAAIDAVNSHFGFSVEEEYGSAVQEILNGLPSAQPEIVRCNSCKHWTQTIGEMRGFGVGECDFHNAKLVTCNGFCYWAERREGEQDG